MMSHILVTGSTGFIGRNLVNLLKEHYSLVGTYRYSIPQDDVIEYVCTELSDYNSVHDLFIKYDFDAVIHLAMQMRGERINDYLINSVQVTRWLIEESEKRNVTTFILSSSIAVYGNVNGQVDEASDRINLDDYATSKYICERMLQDSSIKNRIVLRFPRVLGPRMDLSYPWIPALIGKLIREEEVSYFNPDLPYNNMAYVDTVSEFINLLLDESTSGDGYKLYTLAASEPISVLDIICYLKKGLNSSSNLIERKTNLPRNTCYLIDSSKAQQAGYDTLSVKDTLDLTIKDFYAGEIH